VENNNEVKCAVCGKMFDNPYKVGGDRENMEKLDSLGETESGEYKHLVLCDECEVSS